MLVLSVLTVQMVAIPPHAPDEHQLPEHAIGTVKGHVTKIVRRTDRPVKDMRHTWLQELVRQGAAKYTADSWRENMHRLMQCLRLISAPTDQWVTVTHHAGESSAKRRRTEKRRGTDGNYCYPDFS